MNNLLCRLLIIEQVLRVNVHTVLYKEINGVHIELSALKGTTIVYAALWWCHILLVLH